MNEYDFLCTYLIIYQFDNDKGSELVTDNGQIWHFIYQFIYQFDNDNSQGNERIRFFMHISQKSYQTLYSMCQTFIIYQFYYLFTSFIIYQYDNDNGSELGTNMIFYAHVSKIVSDIVLYVSNIIIYLFWLKQTCSG